MTITSDPKASPKSPSAPATDPAQATTTGSENDNFGRDEPEEDEPEEDEPEEDEPEEDEPEEDEPEEDEPEEDEPDAARDPRRAAFLDDLPDNPQLQPLVAAFVAGNYGLLRELEQALPKQTEDPEVLAAARELVERTDPDPLSKMLLGLSILFFLFIVGWVYLRHVH